MSDHDNSASPTYAKRYWLNPDGHASTGSVVVFDGPSTWLDDQGNVERMMLVEIADCHGKVRLHQAKTDTREEFTAKVRMLRDVLSAFLGHLETEPNGEVRGASRLAGEASASTVVLERGGDV